MTRSIGPIGLVLLQSTSFCNIDCAYCYLPSRTDRRKIMDVTTVAEAARLIFDTSLLDRDLDIVWHAGEPLTLSPDYYDRAIAILEAARSPGVKVRYGMQTNGTLIDDAWIDFFRTHRINVGISLDGPRNLHDFNRRYRNGSGSHRQVMAGISRLRAHGYPFHIIGVVNAPTLARPAELMAFYRALQPTAIGLNIEEIEAQNLHSSLGAQDIAESFERFIAEVLREAAMEDGGNIVIRDFQRTMSSLIGGVPEDNDQVIPLRIVNIASNGDISTFSPELLALSAPQVERFVFGNVHHCAALGDILENDQLKAAYAEIKSGVKNCAAECAYFQYCGGGAPVNKLSETGRLDATETMFCRLTKKAWVDVCLRFANAPESRFEFVSVA